MILLSVIFLREAFFCCHRKSGTHVGNFGHIINFLSIRYELTSGEDYRVHESGRVVCLFLLTVYLEVLLKYPER